MRRNQTFYCKGMFHAQQWEVICYELTIQV